MTRSQTIVLAAGGSLALLAGAFMFQALGYAPCKMCIWQRWPHAAAIAIGVLAILLPQRAWAYLGALAAATTAGIGLYHTGVERGFWEGPSSCSGNGESLSGLSGESLLSTDTVSVVMCDEVAWDLFGLSMASWNALFSLCLMALWLMAARRA